MQRGRYWTLDLNYTPGAKKQQWELDRFKPSTTPRVKAIQRDCPKRLHNSDGPRAAGSTGAADGIHGGASAEPPHLVCSGEMRLLNANGVAIENTICLSALPFSEQFCSRRPNAKHLQTKLMERAAPPLIARLRLGCGVTDRPERHCGQYREAAGAAAANETATAPPPARFAAQAAD